MLKVSGNSIYLTRGDSACFELEVEDSEGNTYDYSEDTVVFSLKKRCSDPTVLIQKTFDEDGKIYFDPADTAKLAFGDYLYDIQLTHTEEPEQEGDDPVVTVDTIIVPSTFTIGAEVTY